MWLCEVVGFGQIVGRTGALDCLQTGERLPLAQGTSLSASFTRKSGYRKSGPYRVGALGKPGVTNLTQTVGQFLDFSSKRGNEGPKLRGLILQLVCDVKVKMKTGKNEDPHRTGYASLAAICDLSQ